MEWIPCLSGTINLAENGHMDDFIKEENASKDFVSVKYCRNIKPKSDFAVIILVK